MHEFFMTLYEQVFTKLTPMDYLDETLTTLKITLLSTAIAYLIGIPLGVLLYGTSKDGIFPQKQVNSIVGFVVNVLRSIPFIILLIMTQPIASIVAGSRLGDNAFIFYLVLSA